MGSIKQPLISVIITNYNRESTIGLAIESALKQDYKNLEIIVSDNSSTDNSWDVINIYKNQPRIKLYRNNSNIGMWENFRVSIIERAQGEYFTFLNSDDVFINGSFITKAVNLISKYENIEILKAGSYFSKGNYGKIHGYKDITEFYNGLDFIKKFDFSYDIGWVGIMLRRKSFIENKYFDIQIISSDYLVNLNLLTKGNIVFLKEICYQFNQHEENFSKQAYKLEELTKIFYELDSLYNHLKMIFTDYSMYNSIIYKIEYAYFANILEDNFRNNRKNIKPIEKLLKERNFKIYRKYIISKRRVIHNITFFIPKIGFKIEEINWRYLHFFSLKK
jgi:glycosyltransferase involved in cell wall biosynthesis